jgi:hypothetical protein
VLVPERIEYLKDLCMQWPAAKITEITQFTPAAWAKSKAKEKVVAHAPRHSAHSLPGKARP